MKTSAINIPEPLLGRAISPWRWWFAWRPASMWDGQWVWLARVWRRRIQSKLGLPGPLEQWWQYHYPRGYVAPENNGAPK